MSHTSIAVKEHRGHWIWPIDLNRYDRSLGLTTEEKRGISALLLLPWRGQYDRIPWRTQLKRLLDPISDSLRWMNAGTTERATVVKLLLREMERSQKSLWKWTPTEWVHNVIDPTSSSTRLGKSSGITRARPFLLALSVLLRRITDISSMGRFDRTCLANKLFGSVIEEEVKRVTKTLMTWGYASRVSERERFCLCAALLQNGSPYLEDLSLELLKELYESSSSTDRRIAYQRISKALCSMGIISEPIPNGYDRARGGKPLDVHAGVSDEWQLFVTRWRETSTLSEKGRFGIYYSLVKAGRWVTETYPELASPDRWTRETAAAYVAAVCCMKVGDWTVHVNAPSTRGKPLKPRAIVGCLTAVRIFFRDCQDWEWIPRRFDPGRCLQAPFSIRARIGPDPRVIADDVWAKLVWAGLNLEPSDFFQLPNGHTYYPMELVRAVATVWLFAGLRCDEIRRLRVGCIRQQTLETGGTQTCILHVPVTKTSTAFAKPVDPIIGRVVAAWELVRPAQPALLDEKTGELVDFLFGYRARKLSGRYLNRMLIPALCTKAGVPSCDARGAITSHRGRATIASQLYNGKEPLSLFELQEWMGHRSPQSTQCYAKISATKLAKSYDQAGYFERNRRAIGVLIDQDAIRTGLKEGEPWKFYDLGHGYCSYDFFDQCPHRMACAKCSFYRPKTSTQSLLLEGKTNLLRLRQEIPLQEVEVAAIDEGIAAFDSLLSQLEDVPTPAGLTPRQLQSQALVQIHTGKEGKHDRED